MAKQAGKKGKGRRKVKKVAEAHGVAHIKATFNNTNITITNAE